MKTISINDSVQVAGGNGMQTALNLLAAKITYDFAASAFAGALGSVLVRNTLNFVAQPLMLNPSLVIGITCGMLGGGFTQNMPALTHNMGASMVMGALGGLASYTTNTTNILY